LGLSAMRGGGGGSLVVTGNANCNQGVRGRNPSSKTLKVHLKSNGFLQLLKVFMRSRCKTSCSDEGDAEVMSFGISRHADS
jgi:hypothetical protein